MSFIIRCIHTQRIKILSLLHSFIHTTCFDTVIPSSEEMSVLLTQTILSEVAYTCVHVMLTTQFEV